MRACEAEELRVPSPSSLIRYLVVLSTCLAALLPASAVSIAAGKHYMQLYGMYVGEGEAVLRDSFRRARLASPAIIFLDEADALAPRRWGFCVSCMRWWGCNACERNGEGCFSAKPGVCVGTVLLDTQKLSL
jgi:hypothetical protein